MFIAGAILFASGTLRNAAANPTFLRAGQASRRPALTH